MKRNSQFSTFVFAVEMKMALLSSLYHCIPLSIPLLLLYHSSLFLLLVLLILLLSLLISPLPPSSPLSPPFPLTPFLSSSSPSSLSSSPPYPLPLHSVPSSLASGGAGGEAALR